MLSTRTLLERDCLLATSGPAFPMKHIIIDLIDPLNYGQDMSQRLSNELKKLQILQTMLFYLDGDEDNSEEEVCHVVEH